MNSIVCPISIEKIDSNVSRLTVFMNVVFLVLFVATQNPVFITIVAADYLIRAAFDMKFSPIRFIAVKIIGLMRLEKKETGLAPKVFASRLGVLCAAVAVVLFLTGYTLASVIVAWGLLVLGFLDAVFDLCVGCLIYNYIVLPWSRKKG